MVFLGERGERIWKPVVRSRSIAVYQDERRTWIALPGLDNTHARATRFDIPLSTTRQPVLAGRRARANVDVLFIKLPVFLRIALSSTSILGRSGSTRFVRWMSTTRLSFTLSASQIASWVIFQPPVQVPAPHRGLEVKINEQG